MITPPGAASATSSQTGRTARARQHRRILDATVELLLETGFAGLTVEGIAESSGVNKTTIYRWWPSKEALAADAVIEIGQHVVPVPDTGTLRADLIALLGEIVASMQDARTGLLLREVIAESIQSVELAEVMGALLRARRVASFEVLDRATARGELPLTADFDLLVDLLVGPVYYRFLLTRTELSGNFIETVVDGVLAAVGAGTHGTATDR